MEGKEGNTIFNRSGKDLRKMVFTDYEGPWVLNDFAYELCMAIFNNDRFFRNISEFDDYLYYIEKREGYEAGYTLKLIAPFISATRQRIDLDSMIKVVYVPDAKIAASRILKNCRAVVISTAYREFVEKTARVLGFQEVHASEVDFEMELSEELRKELLDSVDFIASLSGEELHKELKRIFSKIWGLIENFKVIGAKEKAEILESYEPKFPIAIGDSITDCKMFEKAKELGGVAIAFNGNRYALEKADFAIISHSAMAEAIAVEQILQNKKPKLDEKIGKVYELEKSEFEEVVRESMRSRVKLRGIVGNLG
ncbi:MAG: hypothetical protein QXM23_03280 [Archaeoglobaceae archaeon]